ncbi:hypothetical protein M0R01_02435 [bacterium]|nr:hypothetical protein [bacterium]
MNNEIPSAQEYLDSLREARVKFSKQYNSKKRSPFLKDFFAIIVVLGILSYFFFDGNIFNIKFSNPITTLQGNGDYVCSTEISDAADRLKPTNIPSDTILLELNNELARLNNEKVAIENEAKRIKNNPGQASTKRDGELLQLRIDKYTKDVLYFNEKSTKYRFELEEYNEKVRIYNKYLQDNCERN